MTIREYRELLANLKKYRKALYDESLATEYEPTEEFLLEAVDSLDEAITELSNHIDSELDRIESESCS